MQSDNNKGGMNLCTVAEDNEQSAFDKLPVIASDEKVDIDEEH